MATRPEPDSWGYSISHLTDEEVSVTMFGSSHEGRRIDFYKLVDDQPVKITKAEWAKLKRSNDLIFDDRRIGSRVTTHLKSVVFPRKNRKTTHFTVFRFSYDGSGHHRIDVKTLAEAERIHDDFVRVAEKNDERQFHALRQYGDRLLLLTGAIRDESEPYLAEVEAWMDEHMPGSILLHKHPYGLYALCTDHRAAMHFKLKWL